ncbi:hypothetical protein CICLE_v10033609mg [Citrus x clementina]|uniref:14-3-3 domain-containing protein n=1 Tax=Citrus clementina TaxID=85681 RepID=V4VEB6_CITCL|nr:hypothetical protein CICLE_v10033609mg [Citrus x clementina]
MAAPSPREENVYMEKLAEQAEWNLLSVAYKNVIGARRASWCIVSSIEQKDESHGNQDHVSVIKESCGGILKLLDQKLVPTAAAADSKVFYLKMKGDYLLSLLNLAEFKTGDERKVAVENTLNAYKSAQV